MRKPRHTDSALRPAEEPGIGSSVVQARRLSRTYGDGPGAFCAVSGVDLDLHRGELVALLGQNGAGKTSLVEMLAGMSSVSSGSVRVFGRDPVRERRLVRPRTGILLQDAGFAGDLTVTETLQTWAGTLSQPRAIDEVIALVELTGRADVLVRFLSGGERRRLDLAMAILGRPELLFLDEPTTGLDVKSRLATWKCIQAMVDSGTTILLTTHYLEEAERLADRVLLMNDGHLVRQGTVSELTTGLASVIEFADDALRTLELAMLARLPALLGEPRIAGGVVRLETLDTQTTMGALLRLAEHQGARLPELTAKPAALEQVVLNLDDS